MRAKRNRPHEAGGSRDQRRAGAHSTPKASIERRQPSGATLRTLTDHEPSFWLRGQLASVATKYTAGTLRPACPHVAPGALGVVTLWRPDEMACPWCCGALAADPVEDDKCDRCRAYSRPLVCFGFSVIPGRVAAALALCPSCSQKEVPA